MIDTPALVHTTAEHTAVIRLTIPREEIRNVMGPAHGEVMAAVAAQGMTPTGPWFTHHLRMDPATFDFEVGVPVPAPVAPVGRVTPGHRPAATVVRAVLHGSYEGLARAWGELDAWMAAQGHAASTELWERYVTGPESSPDPSAWRTELDRPLKGGRES